MTRTEIIRRVPADGIGLGNLIQQLNGGRRGRYSSSAELRATVLELVAQGRLVLKKAGRAMDGGRVFRPRKGE